MIYPWTDEEDKILADMLSAGSGFTEIAARLRRSRNSCIGRAKRRGYRYTGADDRPPPKQKKRAEIRERKFKLPLVVVKPSDPHPEALGEPCEIAPGCRWIHGDVMAGEWRMCCHERVPGRPYCAHHNARAANRINLKGRAA